MFTGLIQDIGEVGAITKEGDWTIAIKTALPLAKTALGASIACDGICLTVIEKSGTEFKVQVSMETLSKTTAVSWHAGRRVNLEPALCVGDALGGHFVAGHIDGIARVVESRPEKDSLRYMFEVPKEYARYIASKGSIAIDGVSLTVNDVEGVRFGVNIIPYTQTKTTLGTLIVGQETNFEIDLVARYIERMAIRDKD